MSRRFSSVFADKDSNMAINGKFGLRTLRVGVFLLFLLASVSYGASSLWQVESVAISPDGKLVAADVKIGDASFIYKIPVDTGIAVRLTNATTGEETRPSFSPDGKRVAYAYWPGKGKRSRIAMVNVDGSDLRQWSPSGVVDLSPVLSPDNKTIVFSRTESYSSDSPVAQSHPHGWGFFAANLDGTNVRQITNESFYMASPASVSSDGESMVIVAEGLETSDQIAIYSLTHPGSAAKTFLPHVPHEADHRHPILAYPNYAPDGSILFMAATNGKHGFDYDVYRLDLETGALGALTKGNGYATELRVSAEGKTAAFLKWRKNWLGDLVGNQIYLLDVQSRSLRPLEIKGLE